MCVEAPLRFAVCTARSRSEAEAYLPENYEIVSKLDGPAWIIKGRDRAGWTLDGYVIPRYASGLIGCREFTQVQAEYNGTRPGYALLDASFGVVHWISVDHRARVFNADDELTNAMARA